MSIRPPISKYRDGMMAAPSSLSSAAVRDVVARAQAAAGAAGGLTPSPEDWRDRWIYFLMVDRFNHPGEAPPHRWDDPEYSGYQGGTYAGVREALPYIRDLGAGAIWLSPVLKNLPFDPFSYHGYGIHDFLRAEPRFASDPSAADEELRSLVDAAHRLGLFVIFDIVLNHVGDAFAYDCDASDGQCQGTGGAQASFRPVPGPVRWRDTRGEPAGGTSFDAWPAAGRPAEALVWPAELQADAFFRRQGVPAPDGDDTIGDFQTLKQMRTDDAALQDLLIHCYRYVIARWDVDGFRIDTLRYLKGGLARLFGSATREFALTVGKKNFFTFGEVFDSRAEQDIARFIGRNTAADGDLIGIDAALDYPLYFVLPSIAKGFLPPSRLNDMYSLRKTVERDVVSSHGDATSLFVTFLDNHDVKHRIRYVEPDGSHPFDDQVTLALACLFALPGIPCVYYGTEQGLHGAGAVDAAVREALWAGPGFVRDGRFYAALARIAATRAELPALRYGRLYLRPVSGDGVHYGVSETAPGVLAVSRIVADQEVVTVANTSTTADRALDVIVDQSINGDGDQLLVRYGNLADPAAPGPLTIRRDVTVAEPDGSKGSGPVLACRVTLRPMEVQILAR